MSNQSENTVQNYYDKLIHAIQHSLQQTETPESTATNHKILSARTLSLLKRRQELQRTPAKSRSEKNELSALYKLTNKYIRYDYKNYRLETIQTYISHGKSVKKANKELQTNKNWIESLSKSGKTTYDRKDIITVATHFYKDLYSDVNVNKNDKTILEDESTPGNEISPIDEMEIIQTVKKLKTEKSPGSDNITNEALKIGCSMLVSPLVYLFNSILETADTPAQWSESNIILLYKKGNPREIGNYRPISLLPSLYKLFSSIIDSRVSKTLEINQPVEQAGFRKGFSTIDHIHTLELIIEKYRENQRPLYAAYIDYQKAFDTISHESIWEALKSQGVEKTYIKVIRSIYSKSKSRVKLDSTGCSFPVNRGVRQGDPLSPKLFIAVLEYVMRKIDWKKHGLNIKGKYLSHLRFADDLVILSETSSGLQQMIESLNKASTEVGLEVNLSKTKIMTNSSRKTIMIHNEPIQYVDQYVYLGKQIGFDNSNNELEVERRTRNSWNKYWSYKEIMKSNVPIELKKKILDSCILPCLTYACQTWKFTNKIKNKITTCQRSMERSMLKIKKVHKIRHTAIRKVTKSIDALSYAQKLKFRWAGHVARLKDKRWTYEVTMWSGPPGKRRAGRPYARWEDDVKAIAGAEWIGTAGDRDAWKSLEEAFT